MELVKNIKLHSRVIGRVFVMTSLVCHVTSRKVGQERPFSPFILLCRPLFTAAVNMLRVTLELINAHLQLVHFILEIFGE